jgi:hypothetical protein
MISGYSDVMQLGHKAIPETFWDGEVWVSEKLDGSQISWLVDEDGLHVKAKKAILSVDAPEKMFAPALATIKALYEGAALMHGAIYRAEAVCSPKHNAMRYGRAGKGGLVLYDIDEGAQNYFSQELVQAAARFLGIDYAPILAVYTSRPDLAELKALLDTPSVLGGQIEGICLKNYLVFGRDKKVVMAKLVRPEFAEVNKHSWAEQNPGRNDVIERIIAKYKTPARWMKAVQHLREEGKLQGMPEDIPLLMREVQADVLKEEREEIADELFEFFWRRDISRGITRGAAQWYKDMITCPF